MSIEPKHRSRVTRPATLSAALFACVLAAGLADTAWADPPCWAPAHGYRAKHGGGACGKHARKQYKAGRDARRTSDGGHHEGEYGQPARSGDGHAGGAVSAGGLVGAAIGGYAGSRVGKGSGKLAATAGGAVAGYIVGQEVERSLDDTDR